MDKDYFDKLIFDIKKPSMQFSFEEAEIDGPTTESHLGGLPFRLKKDVWPKCGACNEDMEFIMQLREIDQFESVLLKTIYSCDCQLHNYQPQVQIFQYVNPKIDKAIVSDYAYPIPYVRIKMIPSWSIPKWDMFKRLYPDLVQKIKDDHQGLYGNERDIEAEYLTFRYNSNMIGKEPFSLFGGYPEFAAVPKTSKCTCCNKEAEFVFQLDSTNEYNVDWEQMTFYCYKCKTTGLHSFFLS